MKNETIIKSNQFILNSLSRYLNEYSTTITKEDIEEVVKCGVGEIDAFAYLLAALFNLDISSNQDDKELFGNYFSKMIHKEEKKEYQDNSYYKLIKIDDEIKYKNWTLKYDSYLPYQAFVRDDMIKYLNGMIIPQIGFFDKNFKYLAIYQNERQWMSITPNEINTMKKDIEDSFGDVLTFGLGMGYFSYMASLKDNVNSVTIIEANEEVIELFNKMILPFFKNKDKIHIIHDDAFHYIENINKKYNYLFIDIWHDVSDGLDLYQRFKKYEQEYPNMLFRYWIEKTLICYL